MNNAVNVVTRPMSSNPVRNFTFEQFFEIFKTVQLDISNFWLINSGFDANGQKRYAHLILRGCSIRPLFGPHLVSVFEKVDDGQVDAEGEYAGPVEMKTFWVHSLTDLRRNMFRFHDRLSFERSSYLIPFSDGELLIRLKSIRAFIHVPIVSEIPMTGAIAAIRDVVARENVGIVEEDTSTVDLEDKEKVKMLLNHHVQVMISYLNRELGLKSLASITVLKDYVSTYCDELSSIMSDQV